VRYSQDYELPGMLPRWILRSPYLHARIRNVDASAAPAGVVV
jgi:CO/xanthine dehydrogenase Mo-binding subunit